MREKIILLLSGGLDSATILAMAVNENYDILALSFDYGQKHNIELEKSKELTKFYQVEHRIMKIDLSSFSSSALISKDLDAPYRKDESELPNTIPITYVPARNTIFISLALGLAEVVNANKIFIGANQVDYSCYPDCRLEYFNVFNQLLKLATKAGTEDGREIRIVTPILNLSKAEIIKIGLDLGLDYSMTSSCYNPGKDGLACNHCDSCLHRQKGFKENLKKDPLDC